MKYSEYQPRPDLLKDRIILITGAGDGIGRAAALSYALHGATVVLHGRTLNKLEVIYDEIEGLGAPQPAILPLQLSSASPRDYELLVDTLERQFGRLDGILHNAGILGERTELENYPVDVWDDVMAVNLRAPFVMTQELMPLLKNLSMLPWFSPAQVSGVKRVNVGAHIRCLRSRLKRSANCLLKKIPHRISALTVSIRGDPHCNACKSLSR